MSGDGTSNLPRFRRVEREITRRILAREYQPGQKLPSEAELVSSLGVSRQTVSKALTELAKQGLVTRNRRAGTTVTNRFHERFVLPLYDISADVARRDDIYSFELLARRLLANGEEAVTWPDLGDGETMVELELVHRASGAPVMHELRWISLTAAPGAERESFDSVAPSHWLLANVPWSTVRHRITAVACPASLATLLAVTPGAPCTVLERRTWHLETPITLARLTLAAERFDISGEYTLPTL